MCSGETALFGGFPSVGDVCVPEGLLSIAPSGLWGHGLEYQDGWLDIQKPWKSAKLSGTSKTVPSTAIIRNPQRIAPGVWSVARGASFRFAKTSRKTRVAYYQMEQAIHDLRANTLSCARLLTIYKVLAPFCPTLTQASLKPSTRFFRTELKRCTRPQAHSNYQTNHLMEMVKRVSCLRLPLRSAMPQGGLPVRARLFNSIWWNRGFARLWVLYLIQWQGISVSILWVALFPKAPGTKVSLHGFGLNRTVLPWLYFLSTSCFRQNNEKTTGDRWIAVAAALLGLIATQRA